MVATWQRMDSETRVAITGKWMARPFPSKQAKSGSWHAVGMDGMLGQGGRPMWFKTADEACKAVDRFALGNSGMQFGNSTDY